MINQDYLEQLSGIADMLDMIGAKKEAGVIDKFIKKIADGELDVSSDESDTSDESEEPVDTDANSSEATEDEVNQ